MLRDFLSPNYPSPIAPHQLNVIPGPKTHDHLTFGAFQTRTGYEEELRALPSQRELQEAEQRVGGEVVGLEKDIQYKEADLQATHEKIARHQTEAASLAQVRRLPTNVPEILALSFLPTYTFLQLTRE